MTTSTDEAPENKKQDTESNVEHNSSPADPTLPQEIVDIMHHLSRNTKIIFKSQQRDEPELQQTEKFKVALDVYRRNPQTFLIRFCNYLEEKHLQDFARLSVADSDTEMHLMVKDYQDKLKTRQQDIKNRRYAALKKLIGEGEYFSEQEMMKRQPELYQELVGQYLSFTEKQQRDSYDVKNTTFSGILMHNLEQKQLNEIMEKAEHQVKDKHDHENYLTSSDDGIENKVLNNLGKEDVEIPANCRQQWGNFDNEQVACSTSKIQIEKSPVKIKNKPSDVVDLITADERELLRQEFLSQMHEQFLSGQDKDFDYATVDDNTQFDDLVLINQDKEDEYFEESDEDDSETQQEEKTITIQSPSKMEHEESEDELDVYMFHLNKHHSLQK